MESPQPGVSCERVQKLTLLQKVGWEGEKQYIGFRDAKSAVILTSFHMASRGTKAEYFKEMQVLGKFSGSESRNEFRGPCTVGSS